jgi:lipoate---protein ligase
LLLDRAGDGAPVLLLWRSGPAVVIGKNQNPWRECALPWMAHAGVRLARRVSGGGAVYHDEGNLNYAFIMPRESYETDPVFGQVLAVLADLDLMAERSGRTSLACNGLKVSGTAFCFRRGGALHHGTLLLDADLERMQAALTPPDWTFDTRATSSIPATVCNLRAFRPDLTVERVAEACAARWGQGRLERAADLLPAADIDRLAAERSTDDWLFRQTPAFSVRIPPARGRAERMLRVVKGRVVEIEGGAGADVIGEPFSHELVERIRRRRSGEQEVQGQILQRQAGGAQGQHPA